MTMLDEPDYLATQAQIQAFAGLLKGIPLDAFLNTLNRADTVGAFVDPTLYRSALQSGKLDLVKDVAEALCEAQRKIAKAEERFEVRST